MFKNYLIGGIVSHACMPKNLIPLFGLSPDFHFECNTNNKTLFLLAEGNHYTYRENAKHVYVVAGHVCHSAKEVVNSGALEEIEEHYLANTHFPIEYLEGSFAILFLHKAKLTITIYRNIGGFQPIYYCKTEKGTLFSDSLSILTQVVAELQLGELELNRNQLPVRFVFGQSIGQDTPFKGLFRILPGEQATFSRDSLTFVQLQTFDSITGPMIKSCVDYLEHVMQKIVSEYARTYPQIGSFFSGGVDSSYIQAHLNSCKGYRSRAHETFSIDLIHPSWRTEHEYARSGSDFFNSHHTFVQVDPQAYPSLLIEATAILGQPICHAQMAFIPVLSKAAVQNVPVCLSGAAADALFGLGIGRHLDIAFQINKMVPWKFLRQVMVGMAETISRVHIRSDRLHTIQKCLELELGSEFSPRHPLNTPYRYSPEHMYEVFGRRKVTRAASERRAILNQYQANGNLKERIHSLYLLLVHEGCERIYQLAASAGLKLIFPYLDSRIIKAALSMNPNRRFPFMQTKKVLKDALEKYLPKKLLYRRKSGWGVPIFEWLGNGGVLSQFVEEMNEYPFLEDRARAAKKTQDWFTWDLLTFDLWHKSFIARASDC